MVAQINIGRTESPTKINKIINKSLWVFGTSRNAILVVVCGILGFVFCQHGGFRLVRLGLRALTSQFLGEPPFKVIGAVPKGLPDFKLPPFGFSVENNGTTITTTFTQMISDLGSGIIVLPLVGILENISICKAFGE